MDRHAAPSRRQFLAAAAGAGLAALAGCAGSGESGTPIPTDTAVSLTTVAEGFTAPLDFAPVPDGEGFYVVDQVGQVVHATEAGETETVLDLTDRMVDVGGGYTEQGLLGLAFHPEFAENGRLFVRYSAPARSGTPDAYSHTFVLSEFRATDGTVDADSERVLLEIPEPQGNHNAGALAFGPDGYLFVGVGDGGGSNDQGRGHVADWYDAVGGGNGQEVTENLLGSVLRIDVDGASSARPYAIPADNPLVGREGLDEQYAWGFRNPWRLSIDGGRLFVADVGQNRYEEVNLVERGGNYGWNVREGEACFQRDTCPTTAPDGSTLRDPIVAYPHERNGEAVGLAVVGGHVYRGSRLSGLDGAYVFGDWSTGFRAGNGTLFLARAEGDGWSTGRLDVAGTDDGRVGSYLLSLGQGADGELYALTTERADLRGESGAVQRLDAA
jgi:glucose/arabinose dehydrogenase